MPHKIIFDLFYALNYCGSLILEIDTIIVTTSATQLVHSTSSKNRTDSRIYK